MKTSGLLLKLQILLLGLIFQTLQAQESSSWQKINLYQQRFTDFAKNYPQEKVYLHIDNTSYYLGETIWFKAYVVRADQNSLSQISKILYVELISAEGYVVETVKLKIENGQCNGNFKPITTNYAGFYEVRAYTHYMLNFSPKNYFSRVFPVYDKPKTPGDYSPLISDRLNSQRIPQIRSVYKQKEHLAMTFFPEGGNLIDGLTSRVAFKATEKRGENAVISGIVYNEKNENMTVFSTEHLGMGSFEFTPVSGKYFAKVLYNNEEYRFELPTALAKGYAMKVDNSNEEEINIFIQKNTNTPNEPLGLCISSGGILQDFQKVDMDTKRTLALSVSKKKLPSGVTQITLYNAAGEVVSERLVFVNQHNELKINLSQNKSTYDPFGKVNMEFQFKDEQNNPVQTTFSVSVCDAATSSTNPLGDNILTNLLLSSEVNGYIEDPQYYFQSDDNTHRQALDMLLLTQGWSRYSWKQMAGNSAFKITHPIEYGLEINGTVVSMGIKKKMKDVEITMALASDTIQYGKSKTDSTGNFNFALRDFEGDAKLAIQSKQNGKSKEMYIQLNRNFSPDFKSYSFAELHFPLYFNTKSDKISIVESDVTNKDDSIEKYMPKDNDKLLMDKRVFLLTEVTVKDKRKPIKVSVKYDVAKELDKRSDAGDWMPSNLNTFLHFTCNYYNATTGMYKGKNVIFVKEEFVSEMNQDLTDSYNSEAEKIPGLTNNQSGTLMPTLDEIESVSFIEDHNSIYRIYNGIIDPSANVIALIRCKNNYNKEPYGIRNTTFTGFSYVKEFYSPQYDRMILPGEKDYRRTLYWNPNVKTDMNGKASISFYNNASCKAMNVNAETVTENGMIGVLNK